MAAILVFGPFTLDPASGQLRRHGRRIRLPPQPFQVLLLLASRPGEVVTQEELRRQLWGERTFVEFDLGVYYCIGRIRAVLGDEGRAPRYIETLQRRGYRFVMPVERVAPPGGASLAILPFDNLNRVEEFEYFADGVTDALITEFGTQPGLRVISRQSVLRFKRSDETLATIARQLDVEHLVEGSVLRDAGRVRVTAQLVQAVPERHLWARTVEADAGDVIAVQRTIVPSLVQEITALLVPGAAPRAVAGLAASAAAFEKFLKARHSMQRWTPDGFRTGIALLSEAVALDPTYAAARASLAEVFSLLAFWGHMPWVAGYSRARQLALEAIRLDEASSPAHAALGWTLWLLDWDVGGAERELERGVALNPNNVDALILRGIFRAVVRRDREGAADDALRAVRADPLAPNTLTWATWIFVFTRRFDKAAELARRALEIFPDSVQPLWALGVVHQVQGRPREMFEAFESAVRMSNDLVARASLAGAMARLGDRRPAMEVLEAILAERRGGSGVSLTRPLVGVLMALGDMDAAYAELDAALAARDPVLFFIPITAMFDPLRADPRFAPLMRRFRHAVRQGNAGAAT
jgi:TolB-like protein/tetratricopeptide (TPR) repeat protein